MREWSSPPLPPRWTVSGQPPFVGRIDELALLDAAAAEAGSGTGRAVFITGEPGSGKSRLTAELCRRMESEGTAVIVGTCVPEFGASLEPFDWPMRELLHALEPPIAGDSARIVESTLGLGPNEGVSGVGQTRLFAAVAELLYLGARRHPLVLVLEDLHWADETAIRLLQRIVEGISSSSLLIIGTLRSTAPDRSDSLADVLAELRRLDGVARLDLRMLNIDEIEDYVTARGGVPKTDSRTAAGLLRELTGGNPFLLRETWSHVASANRGDPHAPVDVPASVADLLRLRIAALSADELTVMQTAALLGLEFELGELLAVADGGEAATLDAIDVAVDAGLIDASRSDETVYRFPHAIARQVFLDRLPPSKSIRLHAQIARTLESKFPAAPRLVQRLAHHYGAAQALGFGDRAAAYLARAAEMADARLAFEEAGRLFVRAARSSIDAGARDEFLLRAASSWVHTADFAKARSLYVEVFELGGHRDRLRAAIGFEEASWRPGLPGHPAVQMISAALGDDLVEKSDPLHVEALASLARATAFTGDVDRADELADQAIELARELGVADVLASALRASVCVTFRPRGLAQRLERSEELARLAKDTSHAAYGAVINFRAAACYISGDRSGLDEAECGLVEVARMWGTYWDYYVECVRFGRLFAAGRLDEAADACARVKNAEHVFKSDSTTGANAVQRYLVRRESGRLGSVRRHITGEEAPETRWAPGLLALYTEFEMWEPCRRTLWWLLDNETPFAHESGDWPTRVAFLVEAALALEDREASALIRPWIAEYSGLNLMSGYFVGVFGSADRYLAQIDSLCGTGSPMVLFETALGLDERMGAPLHVCQTLSATAAHLRRHDPGSVEGDLLAERARSIAEGAGLARALRMLGALPRSEASAPDGLSARELEVIQLIGAGLSNRQIAAHLVISEHTAANHVRSILFKTGTANRTRAARYASDHGLL